MTETDKIIKRRIELCDTEVTPLLKIKDEELMGITITPNQFKEYVLAIGQKTMELDINLKEHILGEHSHYKGRMEGAQMVLKLFDLMKVPKVPFICDDGDTEYEDYKCGNCGHRICEDDKFCSECGVALYFEEKEE